jgi:hypothetical protein
LQPIAPRQNKEIEAMTKFLALALLLFATPAMAQQMQTITPNAGGGYTINDPFNPRGQTIVTPNGGGGYTAIQPFNPRAHTYITPNAGGGYTVTRPFARPYGQ